MATIDTTDLISVSEASRMGVSALIKEAEAGHDRVVLRNNKPVAAVLSIQHLEDIQRREDELADISLVASRMLTTSGETHSLDEVLARFGYTRDELRELADE